MKFLETLGVPRLSSSTILGIATLIMASIALATKQLAFDAAVSVASGALAMILLPQHKATPEDGDKPQ